MTPTEKQILEKLGDRIKKIRTEKGLTTRELEAFSGVDSSNITRYELGQKNPSYLTLVKLAKGLEVSIHSLIPKD
ncbi:helix-turn-helix domain-containing protein [Chitinophaga lutea]